MKRFNLCAVSTKLGVVITKAEILLDDPSHLLDECFNKNDWKYNSGTGMDVYAALHKFKSPINVYVVPSKNTKAVAYFQNGSIYIYQNYLDTATGIDLVGTLLHEYAHYCGFNHNSSFGTSNFKTKAKCLYSVPYYLSENVSRWV